MKRKQIHKQSALTAVAVFAFILTAGNPYDTVDELLSKAAELTEQQRPQEALVLYDLAALRAPDPGLVAFNRGVLLLKLDRYSEAERAFRQALDPSDTPTIRRTHGLYNLGLCLAKQAESRDAKRLKAALDCFEQALELIADEPELKADAEFNRHLVEQLWQQAKAKAPKQTEPPERNADPKADPPKPPPVRPESKTSSAPGNDAGDRNAATGKGETQKSDRKPLPGAGSLPVLIDDEEPQRLGPEETKDLLRKADERLRGERQRVREGSASSEKPKPNNW